MIIWLASYPRSGNTMFRMMLNQVFGCGTYSKYFSPERFQKRKEVIPGATGALPLPSPWPDAYKSMSADSSGRYVVKTHDYPEDDQRAIYIVRNGLAAVRSYKHYLWDVNHTDYSIEQVILGEPPFGSWGAHIDAWDPFHRKDTLLLKYEDLVSKPHDQLKRVAEFIDLPIKGEWSDPFEQLHAGNPKMYRQGASVPPEEGFIEQQRQLFLSLHGDWMETFDYSPQASATPRQLRTLLASRPKAQAASAPVPPPAPPKQRSSLLQALRLSSCF